MFESLSTRIQDAFQSLRGEIRLTEENVEAALREIRLALLEATSISRSSRRSSTGFVTGRWTRQCSRA
jgi:signal recognition particle GTPase